MISQQYQVEIIRAETGEEADTTVVSRPQVVSLLHSLKVGDALVINRLEDAVPYDL